MDKPTQEELDEFDRYEAACHAMQSGVAQEHFNGSSDKEPKHLRTGINVSMCDHASLVKLLIEKGIISNIEYVKAIREGMEKEVERYEERLSKFHNTRITLG